MSKIDIKSIIKTGIGIGGMLAPKAVSPILDIVSTNLLDEKDPKNEESFKHLAESVDQIIAVLKNHESRLQDLEQK